jgi:hypothetical protein
MTKIVNFNYGGNIAGVAILFSLFSAGVICFKSNKKYTVFLNKVYKDTIFEILFLICQGEEHLKSRR